MKILVVDDSRVMRRIIVRALRQTDDENHEILEAATGADGIQAAYDHAPDLILSDWNLPEVSGIDFLSRLRAGANHTPFWFVTAENSDYARAQAAAAGAMLFITKPFTADDFAAALEQLREHRTSAAPASNDADETALVHLPSARQVKKLLSDLLDRDVRITPAVGKLVPAPGEGHDGPCTIARYVDERLRPAAVLVCDLPASAGAASAIGLLTPGCVDSTIRNGRLDASLRENLREILEVATALFNVPGHPHLRLHSITHAGEWVDPHVRAEALAVGRREDLTLTIPCYGTGRISLVIPTAEDPVGVTEDLRPTVDQPVRAEGPWRPSGRPG